ncbi:MAG: hypothetical protein N2595_00170 [bacterium]|nr:hypothetical protein [bacterium]
MSSQLYWALLRYALVGGAAVMAFTAHYHYSREPWHFQDVARAASVVPYAIAQRVPPLLRAAALREHNYLAQLLAGHVYGTRAVPVTAFRIWNGLALAVAVVLAYRVATMCGSRVIGVISAFFLAALPPALSGPHAFTMACALLNFECFLNALRRDTVIRWVIWSLASLLLMSCGMFAELFLLQTWFGALILLWAGWYAFTRWLLVDPRTPVPSRRRGRSSRTHQLRSDAGLSRFVVMMLGIALLSLLLVTMGVIFFTRFSLTPTLVIQIVLWSAGLTAATGMVLLFLPLYSRERSIILERVLSSQLTDSIPNPDLVFVPLRVTSFPSMMLAYSAAMVMFLPVVYQVHDQLNVFIRTWDGALIWHTIRTIGPLLALAWILLPFIGAAGAIGLYTIGALSRGRCMGMLAITFISSIYLLQQRYAPFAAPFFLIAVAGVIVTAGKASLYMWQRWRAPKAAAPSEP